MTNEERQRHIELLKDYQHFIVDPIHRLAFDEAISALQREGQMEEAQPSPDLEPVRRLIEKQDHAYIHDAACIFWNRLKHFINDSFHEQLFHDLKNFLSEVGYRDTERVTSALLAEVEQSRTLRKELDTVSGRYGEAMQEIVRLRLEVEKLREENVKLKEVQHGTPI